MAKGVTLRGVPFTREETQSGAVWPGGDRPYQPPAPDGKDDLCRLLDCVLGEKTLTKAFVDRLKKNGINVAGIRNCVKLFCRDHDRRPKR